jgi:hypothetical protein
MDNGEKRGLCYTFTCDAAHTTITFQLRGEVEIVCRRSGEEVTAPYPFRGKITCPDPANYCRDF